MSSASEDARMKAKVISKIHEQLANNFHPALKNAATAAITFQKTQENNQKAFSNYIASLKQVVISAKYAEQNSQELAKDLSELVEFYSKIEEETSKLVKDFTEIAMKLHTNAETEKENHRKALKTYIKEQRNIHHEYDKKRQTSTDLKNFYQTRYDEALRLQSLRYKYFTDKHGKLLKKYNDISKKLIDDYDAKFEEIKEDNTTASHKTESHHNSASFLITEKIDRRITMSSKSSKPEEGTKYANITSEKERSELYNLVSQPEGTIDKFFKELHEENEGSIINNEEIIEKKSYTSSRPPLSQIYIPKIEEEIVEPLPRPTPKARKTEPEYSSASHVAYNNGYEPTPIIAAKPTKVEVIQKSAPQVPKRKEKPLFTAADYGSIVLCTEPFEAKTERQISLNVGDKAELIRCGERGWLLVRTFSAKTQTLGWFPAKFVRLATKEEQEQILQSRD